MKGSLSAACFPHAERITVRLVEDPDEDNHTWVVLTVILPKSLDPEIIQKQRLHYYDQQSQREQLPYHPFSFGLEIQFGEES